MNLWDILLILCLIAAVSFAVIHIVRTRKHGGCSCGGGSGCSCSSCGSCPYSGSCRHLSKAKKHKEKESL